MQEVLEPCGILNSSVLPPPGKPRTRYYACKSPQSFSAGDYPDPFRSCGATGWQLSAKEYAQFINGVSSGKPFIDAQDPGLPWRIMLSEGLGLNPFGAFPGTGGVYAMHGGHAGAFSEIDSGIEAAWFYSGVQGLNRGVVASLLTNCHGGGFHPDGPKDILRASYEASL